jgi:hypothetical protein
MSRTTFTGPLVAAAVTLSGVVSADDARPVHFWVTVIDFTKPHPSPTQYQLTPNAVLPTSLTGWTCKATDVALIQTPSDTPAPPSAGAPPRSPYRQSADVVCTSKAGGVKATASCALTSSDASDEEHMKITDSDGHLNWVSVACRN